MRVSCNWLREYVDHDWDAGRLAECLTMAGIEVEMVETLGQEYRPIRAAHILQVVQHPAANGLRVCHVQADRTYSVVCGADNVSPGDVVPLAPPGTRLPDGRTIEAAEIRGVISEGMLCSAEELGFVDESNGILQLDRQASVGTSVADLFHLEDAVLVLKLTPNRPDCLSMVGVAREVAALTRAPLQLPRWTLHEEQPPASEEAGVEILAADLCPRYSGRLVRGVRIGPSPLWMQHRLRVSGMRPLNNVVDVTNYVMWEWGQPLHAFDFHQLAEHRIVVRRAIEGEGLVTLDGTSHTLAAEMLVIADARQAVALAGIMGGAQAEVTLSSREILLEGAFFEPVNIRRTAKKLGMKTEASYRFERGTDIGGTIRALDRAAFFLCQLAGGRVARGALDAYMIQPMRRKVGLRVSRVNQLLGTALTRETVSAHLRRLGLSVEPGAANEDRLRVEVPSFRLDLHREEDLIEEVARYHGYDRIPSTLPRGQSATASDRTPRRVVAALVQSLATLGFYEVVSYSFTNPLVLGLLRLPEADSRRRVVALRNPLSSEWSVLRTTLLPNLLQIAALNARRQRPGLRLFEIGPLFRAKGPAELPEEWMAVGILCGGLAEESVWAGGRRDCDLYDVKGPVESILRLCRVKDPIFVPEAQPFLHPHQALSVRVGGKAIGLLGLIHPQIAEEVDVLHNLVYAELELQPLIDSFHRAAQLRTPSKFPPITRDLAVVVEQDVAAEDLARAIRTVGGELLEAVNLFDLYTGSSVPKGKKSLAFSLRYQAHDRTLTDEEVSGLHDQIVHSLEEAFGALLR